MKRATGPLLSRSFADRSSPLHELDPLAPLAHQVFVLRVRFGQAAAQARDECIEHLIGHPSGCLRPNWRFL